MNDYTGWPIIPLDSDWPKKSGVIRNLEGGHNAYLFGGIASSIIKAKGEAFPHIREGELVTVKDKTYKVAYVNKSSVTLEPWDGVINPSKEGE